MVAGRALADSVAVTEGRIAAVGGGIPATARVVDCRGGVLLPGFIDPHVHLLAAAAMRRSVDCSPRAVRSIRDIQERLAQAARDRSAGWVRATGYDETALAEGRHPTRWDLDAAVAERPVRLLHRSGHAAVLNSAALALAGISISSAEPPGGVIDRRTGDGEPTGLLIDMDAVIERSVPPLPFGELVLGMQALNAALLRAGVVAVQDLTHQNDADRLALLDRVWNAAGVGPKRLPAATQPEVLGGGPVKLMLAEAGGISRQQRDAAVRAVARAHAAGRQVAVHAVTELGVRTALDAIEQALYRSPRSDHRHRIEHAAVCPPDLAARAASLGVVVVSNPAFLFESGDRYRSTVPAGELPHLYAAGDLAAAGVVVAAASDTPVAPPSPLADVRSAIRRESRSGAALPGTPVDRATALAMVTRNAAFAAFAEAEFGSIAPGRPGHLVLLDRRPDHDQPPTLWWTMVGGTILYAAPDAPALD